jgi:hypothetical protein
MLARPVVLFVGFLFCIASSVSAQSLRIATFQLDVTPPLGSALCEGFVPEVSKIDDPLFVRGVVILGAADPIVLCAVDFVGLGNSGYDAWREALAKGAGTLPYRVAVHALHQQPSRDHLRPRSRLRISGQGRRRLIELRPIVEYSVMTER